MENLQQDEQMVQSAEPVNNHLEFYEKSQNENKNGQSKSVFLSVLISVFIILLLSVIGWFLGRKYLWQPQQEYVANQFQTVESKISDISTRLDSESLALLETQENLVDLEASVNELLDKSEPNLVKLLNGEVKYTIPEMHLSVHYPSKWEAILNLQENAKTLIVRTADTEELMAKQLLAPYYENNLMITYYENWDQLYALDLESGDLLNNVEDLFSGEHKLPFLWTKIGETQVAGQKAYEFIAGAMGQHYGFLVENDLGIYVFELRRSTSKKDLSEEDAALLQKIKFLE